MLRLRYYLIRCLLPAVLLLGSPGYSATTEALTAKTFFPASEFPVAEQRRLTDRVLGHKWLRDTEAEEYLYQITHRLAPEDENFIVLAAIDEVNAFAYLGGLIVVYRGLWDFAGKEEEFISVIAHEMAHIKLRHVQKGRENAERASVIATPLLIAGILAGDPETREAIVAGSVGLLSSDIIAYSRELEHEADTHALESLLAIGYDGEGMVDIFSRFETGGSEYLSTHPSADRRAGYLAARRRTPDVARPPATLDYYLLRKKFERQEVIERQYQQKQRAILNSDSSSEKEKLLAQYGLLLSANKTRNRALGEEMSAALKDNNNPMIIRAVAKNMRQRKKIAEAVSLLEQARAEYPERRSLLLEVFVAYEQQQQYTKILEIYNQLPRAIKEHPDVLQASGRAAALLQQHFLSHYLLARGQAQNGDFEQALQQISIAEKFKSSDKKTVLDMEKLKKKLTRELRLIKERRVLEDS